MKYIRLKIDAHSS